MAQESKYFLDQKINQVAKKIDSLFDQLDECTAHQLRWNTQRSIEKLSDELTVLCEKRNQIK